MNRALPVLALVVFAGCAAPKAPETASTSASLTKAEVPAPESAEGSEPTKSAAEQWAEAKMAKEAQTAKESKDVTAPRESLDPLAENSALEEASIPKIEKTPAKELRSKSRGDLDAGLAIVKQQKTVDDAVRALTTRLGKPTWTENGKKRVWVANDGSSCHRLVLEADGEVSVESAPKTEWRMLTALSHQNACSGDIRRGAPGSN